MQLLSKYKHLNSDEYRERYINNIFTNILFNGGIEKTVDQLKTFYNTNLITKNEYFKFISQNYKFLRKEQINLKKYMNEDDYYEFCKWKKIN